MVNYQENKNLYISSFVTFVVFSILFLLNIQSLKEQNIYINDYLPLSTTIINLFFIFIILPSLVFILLQNILLRYVSFLWASSISALSIFSYAGYDFKQFIYDIILNFEKIESLTPKKIILFEYPNISFSILIFLFLTWLCLKLNRFNLIQIIIITGLWSGFSLLSFSGSIIGILFWIIYSPIRLFRLKKTIKHIFIITTFNLLFYILFVYLFKSFVSIDGNTVNNIYNFTLGYFLFYFALPIIGILLIYRFYKIDFYEIFVKFTPIYVLMLSDFIISVYLASYKFNYQNHEYFIYPHFILHFLYILPIIYYLGKPLSPFVENKKTKINILKKYIFIFFSKTSKIYLPLIIILLLIFSILPSKIIL